MRSRRTSENQLKVSHGATSPKGAYPVSHIMCFVGRVAALLFSCIFNDDSAGDDDDGDDDEHSVMEIVMMLNECVIIITIRNNKEIDLIFITAWNLLLVE